MSTISTPWDQVTCFGNAAPHADGVQLNGGASSVVIRHNTIDPIPSGQTGGTSGIIGNTSGDNVRIEDNTIDGGGSSLRDLCTQNFEVSLVYQSQQVWSWATVIRRASELASQSPSSTKIPTSIMGRLSTRIMGSMAAAQTDLK